MATISSFLLFSPATYRRGARGMSISFKNDIKPLFREEDVDEMVPWFDLSKIEDVKSNAENILERLSDGTMPPDGEWPEEQIAKFKKWMDEGMPE
jgi:hypothetical protein